MARRAKNELTPLGIDQLKAPAAGRREVFDRRCPGLCVRITSTGAKSFSFYFRLGGRSQRITLGPVSMGITKARKAAEEAREEVREGRDPRATKRAVENATRTVRDLGAEYLRLHAKPKKCASSAAADERKIDTIINPALGKRTVREIGRHEIESLHHKFAAKPYKANRVLALLSRMFTLAVRWGWRTDNPCQGVERYAEQPRERFLSAAELARLAEALGAVDDQNTANAIRLLLLTGARKSEVLQARWEQFDLSKGVWTKPSAHTKQRKVHRIPLSPPVLKLLEAMPRTGEYLFPGRVRGKPLQDIKKTWTRALNLAEIEGFRLHDLRHTYASVLVSSGASLPIIGALLGHTQAATTQRYAHLLDDPLREATGRMGTLFEGLGKDKAGEVVDLEKRRA